MLDTDSGVDHLSRIGMQGDALWAGQTQSDPDGIYVDVRDVPPEEDYGPFRTIAIAIGLVVAVTLWRLERMIRFLLDRSYFCPLCLNPMEEPLVSCSYCGRVQSRLRPTTAGVFVRRCRCGMGRWPILGSLFASPKPLVCRDTEAFEGCYRPHRLPELAGRYRSDHAAIVGTSIAAKHAFMGYFLSHLALRHRTAWPMSELELRLCRTTLGRGFEEDTARCETPGRIYTLARAFILHAHGRSLWVFHNLLNSWLATEADLLKYSPTWDRLSSILLVIDGDRLARPEPGSRDQPSEHFSRLLRDIEKFCLLSPNDYLPMRVAVVVACSTKEKMTELLAGTLQAKGEPVKNSVMNHDPALHALLVRTVDPRKLKFWGWAATGAATQASPTTALEVGEWMMSKHARPWRFRRN